MRAFDAATAAAMQAGAYQFHLLAWVSGRNRTTGAVESIGFWTGEDAQTFNVDGQPRVYFGCGNALDVDPIRLEPGYGARSLQIRLGGIRAEGMNALRVYDPRFAPVELHRAVFDTTTHQLVAPPHRLFKGSVDEVSLPTPQKGGTEVAQLSLVSSAIAGTKNLTLRKSDEELSQRTGDRFRRYIAVSNAVPVWWGEERDDGAASNSGSGAFSAISAGELIRGRGER